ncbi:Major facilitator superfamily (MFS) profile domain-containing protein [Caenorhabditis elegans]|uniref:Major facilitator superfamily (MFS) profile domain-containing protein n=1 Tax=Caenorhabditis elegans TaxID=6239 RepID=Q19296_CAEEL|nr:Major facilitator superfamily (MFS) profile domain-containing protein [Caenorhabditis elegans]CCD67837.1 Major facilitator superfamily (MFS) profile domain-containing protein [Caenorhabditis elegans]|eukprot:NP_510814.1 Uncharacterized protein CELE_F10D7.2 [Caenorhabditis elegans]
MTAIGPVDKKAVMKLLIPALICNMLAFTSILPLFPTILNYYSKEGHRDWLYDISVKGLQSFQEAIGVPHSERYDKVFFGGFLGSLFSALQFISSPTLGSLSDIYGRRAVISLCCIMTFISYVNWLKADIFAYFVLSRILGGLSKGNINVATAIVSDVYSPEDHPKGMALIGISYSLGFLIGPMIGAYFSTIASIDSPFAYPAMFSIILTILEFGFLFFLPETLDLKEQKSLDDIKKTRKELVTPKDLFQFTAVNAPQERKQEMQKVGWIYFLFLFLYSGLEFTLPFLTHIRFDFDNMQQGKVYLFTGLLMLPIQAKYVRKTPIEKQKAVAEFGIACIIPAYLLVAVAKTPLVLYAGLFFYAIASATVVTSLTSLVHVIYPQSEKGVLAGIFRSLGCLARALGPVISSTFFWLLGATTCYIMGAFLLFIPLILLKRLENPAAKKTV